MMFNCETYAWFDPNAIERIVESQEQHQPESKVDTFHKLWKELHTKDYPTPKWLAFWMSQVPKFGCDCESFLRKYIADNPPRYDDWFAWTWELHNAVNAKLSCEQTTLDNARACWLGIAKKTKPRLVITIATGTQFKKVLSVTRPYLQAYANRCDADYIELTNQSFDQWQLEKFRVHGFAKQYEQTLFIDSDCYVRPSCPDIFEMGETMLHADIEHNTWWPDWAPFEYGNVLASQGLASKPVGQLLNSGVVLCSKKTADIWKPPAQRLPDSHCSEQWWVQHQCDKFDVTLLPTEFNVQYWFKDFYARLSTAQIIHAANAPNKTELLQKLIAEYP
jgi:hypothetical protein